MDMEFERKKNLLLENYFFDKSATNKRILILRELLRLVKEKYNLTDKKASALVVSYIKNFQSRDRLKELDLNACYGRSEGQEGFYKVINGVGYTYEQYKALNAFCDDVIAGDNPWAKKIAEVKRKIREKREAPTPEAKAFDAYVGEQACRYYPASNPMNKLSQDLAKALVPQAYSDQLGRWIDASPPPAQPIMQRTDRCPEDCSSSLGDRITPVRYILSQDFSKACFAYAISQLCMHLEGRVEVFSTTYSWFGLKHTVDHLYDFEIRHSNPHVSTLKLVQRSVNGHVDILQADHRGNVYGTPAVPKAALQLVEPYLINELGFSRTDEGCHNPLYELTKHNA